MSVFGQEKCQGLIDFHNFTGANWGGEFVGISKKSWITSYLSLPNDDPIVSAFQLLGERVLTSLEVVDGELPEEVCPSRSLFDQYTAPGGATTTPALRWELFRSRNLEGEKLPLTRATLIPHILRTTIVGMRDKSYTTPHPCLLPLEEMDGCLPETSMSQSGVSTNQHQLPSWNYSKCCKTSCKGDCSCKKNNIPCTALCKCHSSDCCNFLSTG